MIDYLTLALTHGLIALALWRLAFRPELDAEGGKVSSASSSGRKTNSTAKPGTGSIADPGDA